MGYSVHIRRESQEGAESDISTQEIEAWAAARSDVHQATEIRGTNPATGAVIRVPGSFFVWSHPDGGQVYLDHSYGQIQAKNLDDATIAIMKELAQTLGAVVEGDGGERY